MIKVKNNIKQMITAEIDRVIMNHYQNGSHYVRVRIVPKWYQFRRKSVFYEFQGKIGRWVGVNGSHEDYVRGYVYKNILDRSVQK